MVCNPRPGMIDWLLELGAARVARPVLRGGGGSDATSLPNHIAQIFHLHGALMTSEEDEARALESTAWVVLSRSAEIFRRGALRGRGEPLETSDRVEYWTDDYHNLFRLLGIPEHLPHSEHEAPPK